MQIVPRIPTTKNPAERFTGDVWLDPLASPQETGQRLVVAKVRFAPSARTAWPASRYSAHDRRRRTWPSRIPVHGVQRVSLGAGRRP